MVQGCRGAAVQRCRGAAVGKGELWGKDSHHVVICRSERERVGAIYSLRRGRWGYGQEKGAAFPGSRGRRHPGDQGTS